MSKKIQEIIIQHFTKDKMSVIIKMKSDRMSILERKELIC